jgi:hypothetical protein
VLVEKRKKNLSVEPKTIVSFTALFTTIIILLCFGDNICVKFDLAVDAPDEAMATGICGRLHLYSPIEKNYLVYFCNFYRGRESSKWYIIVVHSVGSSV